VYRYVINGHERTLGLGSARGIDPPEHRNQQREAAKVAEKKHITFKAAAKRLFDSKKLALKTASTDTNGGVHWSATRFQLSATSIAAALTPTSCRKCWNSQSLIITARRERCGM
jgi:hypothetical protein